MRHTVEAIVCAHLPCYKEELRVYTVRFIFRLVGKNQCQSGCCIYTCMSLSTMRKSLFPSQKNAAAMVETSSWCRTCMIQSCKLWKKNGHSVALPLQVIEQNMPMTVKVLSRDWPVYTLPWCEIRMGLFSNRAQLSVHQDCGWLSALHCWQLCICLGLSDPRAHVGCPSTPQQEVMKSLQDRYPQVGRWKAGCFSIT